MEKNIFRRQMIHVIEAIYEVKSDFKLFDSLYSDETGLQDPAFIDCFGIMQRSLIFKFHINVYNLIDNYKHRDLYSLKGILRKVGDEAIKNRDILVKKNKGKDACDRKLKENYRKIVLNSKELKDASHNITKIRNEMFAHADINNSFKERLNEKQYHPFIKWYETTILEIMEIYGVDLKELARKREKEGIRRLENLNATLEALKPKNVCT